MHLTILFNHRTRFHDFSNWPSNCCRPSTAELAPMEDDEDEAEMEEQEVVEEDEDDSLDLEDCCCG